MRGGGEPGRGEGSSQGGWTGLWGARRARACPSPRGLARGTHVGGLQRCLLLCAPLASDRRVTEMDARALRVHCPESDSSAAPSPQLCAVGVRGRAGALSQSHTHEGGLLRPSSESSLDRALVLGGCGGPPQVGGSRSVDAVHRGPALGPTRLSARHGSEAGHSWMQPLAPLPSDAPFPDPTGPSHCSAPAPGPHGAVPYLRRSQLLTNSVSCELPSRQCHHGAPGGSQSTSTGKEVSVK